MAHVGKVLAIDDDPVNLDILAEMFASSDHDIKFADTPDQGLSLCQSYDPDILLLDIMMPEKNGYDLCRTIREELDNSELTIVMLTGKILTSDRIEAFKVGADDYITKPFTEEELSMKVNYYLMRHRC